MEAAIVRGVLRRDERTQTGYHNAKGVAVSPPTSVYFSWRSACCLIFILGLVDYVCLVGRISLLTGWLKFFVRLVGVLFRSVGCFLFSFGPSVCSSLPFFFVSLFGLLVFSFYFVQVRAVFGKDPRQYSVMTKEFLSDGNGNVRGLVTVNVEVTKDGIKVRGRGERRRRDKRYE